MGLEAWQSSGMAVGATGCLGVLNSSEFRGVEGLRVCEGDSIGTIGKEVVICPTNIWSFPGVWSSLDLHRV